MGELFSAPIISFQGISQFAKIFIARCKNGQHPCFMQDVARLNHLSEDDTILSAAEAQLFTRTSHTTLRALANSGEIPYIQMSNKPRAHKRYRASDLRKWLELKTINTKNK